MLDIGAAYARGCLLAPRRVRQHLKRANRTSYGRFKTQPPQRQWAVPQAQRMIGIPSCVSRLMGHYWGAGSGTRQYIVGQVCEVDVVLQWCPALPCPALPCPADGTEAVCKGRDARETIIAEVWAWLNTAVSAAFCLEGCR